MNTTIPLIDLKLFRLVSVIEKPLPNVRMKYYACNVENEINGHVSSGIIYCAQDNFDTEYPFQVVEYLEGIPYPSDRDAIEAEAKELYPMPNLGTVIDNNYCMGQRKAHTTAVALERLRPAPKPDKTVEQLAIDAAHYGFICAFNSQNDGVRVPDGNILQWLYEYLRNNSLQIQNKQDDSIYSK